MAQFTSGGGPGEAMNMPQLLTSDQQPQANTGVNAPGTAPPAPVTPSASVPTPAGTPTASVAPPVNYNPNAPAIANTGTSQGYQDAISKQLGQLSQPTDPNSPVVRAQTDAYNLSADRGLAKNSGALAEQAYASGDLNSGGAGQMQQQARETTAAGEAQNTGQVMATAEAQRQAQLGQMMGLGSNAALQQQQLTAGQNEFAGQLGLNYGQLQQNQGQFGVTSAQQQEAINNQLAGQRAQTNLGYAGITSNEKIAGQNTDLGYYNTQQGIGNQQAMQQAAINAQMAQGQAGQ